VQQGNGTPKRFRARHAHDMSTLAYNAVMG
jgi:hypothetical protein